MTTINDVPLQTTTSRATIDRLLRPVAVLIATLILVQALLAGRGWFINYDLIATHGWVGNATFLVVIVQVVLAFIAWRQHLAGVVELGLSVALLLLVVSQIGLGYSGRESATAAALHIPNGVLIFGVTTALLTLTLPRRGVAAS